MASATARWWARRVPRLNSSRPSCGHGHDAQHEPVVEHGQPRRLEHLPADLGPHVRALLVPLPRPHHVAVADQLHAVAAEHVDVAAEQAVDDQEAAVVLGRLVRRRGVPLARREPLHAGERLAPRALELVASSRSARSGSASTRLMTLLRHAALSYPAAGMSDRRRRAPEPRARAPARPRRPTVAAVIDRKENRMLWLIIGIVLLVIAIAGGAIVHPILFVLAILALIAFFVGWRGRAL